MTHSNTKTKRKSGKARKRDKEQKALTAADASKAPEELQLSLETTPEEVQVDEVVDVPPLLVDEPVRHALIEESVRHVVFEEPLPPPSQIETQFVHAPQEDVVLPTPTEPPKQLDPIIVDPGNGPRVQDVARFLNSPFADPVNLDDERCADLCQPEVMPILLRLLPMEMALLVFYNATRTFGRICPACRRIYRVGDQLAAHLADGTDRMHEGPQTRREQMISGLCSWMCFAIASYPYPGSVGAWGKRGDELDPGIIAYLNGPGDPNVKNDEGFGQLLRMTRNEWLGIDPWRKPMLAYMAGLAGDPLPPYMPQ